MRAGQCPPFYNIGGMPFHGEPGFGRMKLISSPENRIVKETASLSEKKYRERYNAFLVEGEKLVAEAVAQKRNIKAILHNMNSVGVQTAPKIKTEEVSLSDDSSKYEIPSGGIVSESDKKKEEEYEEVTIYKKKFETKKIRFGKGGKRLDNGFGGSTSGENSFK